MQRVRLRPLKRFPGIFSLRSRCPREECRGDFSVWVRCVEAGRAEIVGHPDQVVLAYAAGEGTTTKLARRHGLYAASTVWRAVDSALDRVSGWIERCTRFLGRQAPEVLEALHKAMKPEPPAAWAGRRFRKPQRTGRLGLLRQLPRWMEACTRVLQVDWPYGVVRFFRMIDQRLASLEVHA